jgi:hypothetical protein
MRPIARGAAERAAFQRRRGGRVLNVNSLAGETAMPDLCA